MRSQRGYYDVLVRTCTLHHSRVAVRALGRRGLTTLTYSELYGVCEYVAQNLQLMRCARGIIGILTHRNPLLPAIIAAVHKNSPTFMFLDPSQKNSHIPNGVTFQAIISLYHKDKPFDIIEGTPEREICLYDYIIKFYKSLSLFNNNTTCNDDSDEHSFIITTSGSTGEPKQVKVPIKCMQPNIDDLIKMFNINFTDVVYFSTPLTFDPSMVELLLACSSGASLLLAPPTADIFTQQFEHSATVWQVTPSVFFQFKRQEIAEILSANSKLKILAFGGEPLNNLKTIKELKNTGNNTRIFCLYGVTELSCWACATELNLDNINDSKEIPLGDCLSETEIRIMASDTDGMVGKIKLGSRSRKCSILNNKSSPTLRKGTNWIDTGDIGEYKNGTVYFRGRTDDIVKRFGHKVNLQHIEKTAMLSSKVNTCSCIWLQEPNLLMLYYTSDTLFCDELKLFLRNHLDDRSWPDKIVRIDTIPLNRHGKVCKDHLVSRSITESLSNTTDEIKTCLMKELRSSLKHRFTYNEIKDKDYFTIGGTSFLAVTMCNKIAACYPHLKLSLLPSILKPNNTIEYILKSLNIANKDKCRLSSGEMKKKRKASPALCSKAKKILSPVTSTGGLENVTITIDWSHNTGKCVDATPTVVETMMKNYISVGSHSGKVVVLNTESGAVTGKLDLKSRVEAPVFCYQHAGMKYPQGVVGTYNGTVVCFSLNKCTVSWKFSVHEMIKSKITMAGKMLYVASYDGKLRCVHFLNGNVLDIIDIGEHGICSDLVTAREKFVIVATLGGICKAFDTESHSVVWAYKAGSPIFAAPLLYDDDRFVVIAEVDGVLHCLSVRTGALVWKYEDTHGNVFSSISLKLNSTTNFDLVFGCHDCNLYCLNIEDNHVKLKWKADLGAAIYSTPCYFSDKMILAFSIKGKLHAILSDSGTIVSEYSLPGETFSSPVTLEDQIFIGCRDDMLYSLKCTIT